MKKFTILAEIGKNKKKSPKNRRKFLFQKLRRLWNFNCNPESYQILWNCFIKFLQPNDTHISAFAPRTFSHGKALMWQWVQKMELAGFFLDNSINRDWELNTQPNLVQLFRFMPRCLVQNMKSIQEDVQRLWQIDFLMISVIALLSGWPHQKGLRTSHTTKLSTTVLAHTLMLNTKY